MHWCELLVRHVCSREVNTKTIVMKSKSSCSVYLSRMPRAPNLGTILWATALVAAAVAAAAAATIVHGDWCELLVG